MKQRVSEAYSEPSRTSKMEFFVKMVKDSLIFFAKCFIVDVRLCSEYES